MESKTEEKQEEKRYLREVSLWSVEQIEKMGLSLFFNKAAAGKLSKEEKNEQVNALMWLHHTVTDEDEAEAAVKKGSWPAEVKKFKRHPESLAGLSEVEDCIIRAKEMVEGRPHSALLDGEPN